MLFKSLEFKNSNGQKVKVIDIPVLEESNSYHFMLGLRLQAFMSEVYKENGPRQVYSFKEYLKKVLRWTDYEKLFTTEKLKYNA